MAYLEIIFGVVLVVILLGIAGYFGFRQKQTLRTLRHSNLAPEDRIYLLKQVRRRILCSVLMVVFAGLLAGWFFLESQVQLGPEQAEADRSNAIRQVTIYWIVALFVLFAILFLAALDLVATARFGFRQQRRLEGERRAMLEEQAQRLRQERNGHQG